MASKEVGILKKYGAENIKDYCLISNYGYTFTITARVIGEDPSEKMVLRADFVPDLGIDSIIVELTQSQTDSFRYSGSVTVDPASLPAGSKIASAIVSGYWDRVSDIVYSQTYTVEYPYG